MALDDYVDKNVAIAVAGTAAALSSPVRKLLHQGAVYGIAGILMVGDGILSFGRGLTRGFRQEEGATPVEPVPEQTKGKAPKAGEGS